MKPVLIVDGKRYPIISVTVGDLDTQHRYYDSEIYSFMDPNETIDLSKTIINPIRENRNIECIEKLIDESVERLITMKIDLADRIVGSTDKYVFDNVKVQALIKDIEKQVDFIEGLECASDILRKREVSSTDEEVGE